MHIFIISWKNQHDNAIAIAKSLEDYSGNISIVYSDPDPHFIPSVQHDLIRRPSELFWGDKFEACINACNSDVMLIIHADCTCEDWAALAKKCHSSMVNNPVIGVWAPIIDWVNIPLEKTRIFKINDSSLNIVAQTDAIVFCLSGLVIDRLKLANFKDNLYGWGIDTMAVTFAYANNKIAVVDEEVIVHHPKTRGYPSELALLQCNIFLRQLTITETVQNRLLWAHINRIDSK